MSSPVSDNRISEYNQASFSGGMNLLLDDTRLQSNQYRIGFNVRARYDILTEVNDSVLDTSLPPGVIQELVTFGNFLVVFVAGNAYYRLYSDQGWTQIVGFSMSTTAARYWTVPVPVTTTLYGRIAAGSSVTIGMAPITTASVNSPIQQVNTTASNSGNLPGLLVQDNINQPFFIFLNASGVPEADVTFTYDQWTAVYDAVTGNLVTDGREYVPVGNSMAWASGILFIVDPSKNIIYRSVSGRPLDFMVNVDTTGQPGGAAFTTAYSVGVGGISVIRPLATGGIFVGASNSNYSVTLNTTQSAPTIFGEYTFIRQFLFEATCLSDRCIIDSLGDTKFIDLTGVRSFNAIAQLENEGRNAPFTATVARAFQGLVQDVAAAILYDNFELYAVTTIFGPAIAVYDTINSVWTSFDLAQTGGAKIKALAKIELGVQRLFAVTEDDELFTLYSGNTFSTALIQSIGISANMLYANQNIKLINPKNEVKLLDVRAIASQITQNSTITMQVIVDNRISALMNAITKTITYVPPVKKYTDFALPDINTQLQNILWPTPNCEQGWKVGILLSWTGGCSITQFSCSLKDETPQNPLTSQGRVK